MHTWQGGQHHTLVLLGATRMLKKVNCSTISYQDNGGVSTVIVSFFYLVCEAIGTAATPGLLCQPRVIVKMIVKNQMECRLAGATEFSEETCPSATFVHHKIPHNQTRVWTRTAAVGDCILNQASRWTPFYVFSVRTFTYWLNTRMFSWGHDNGEEKNIALPYSNYTERIRELHISATAEDEVLVT
jgi:hypothetical protein